MRTNKSNLYSFPALMILGALASIPAVAAPHHPAYLEARTDLRKAQMYLRIHETPDIMRFTKDADARAERAIQLIDRAGEFDHVDIDDHPSVDANLEKANRFQKVLDLMRQAKYDLGHEEDAEAAKIWRNEAFANLETAIQDMQKAAKAANIDHLENR